MVRPRLGCPDFRFVVVWYLPRSLIRRLGPNKLSRYLENVGVVELELGVVHPSENQHLVLANFNSGVEHPAQGLVPIALHLRPAALVLLHNFHLVDVARGCFLVVISILQPPKHHVIPVYLNQSVAQSRAGTLPNML